jgi:putative ABC transport system ATP-binding protein
MQIFQSLNAEGKTIIIITHESDIAAQTKRIINIRDGNIV